MSENTQNLTYYQKNRGLLLKKAKEFYDNNKEKEENMEEIDITRWRLKKKIK